jgi:transcriptional regulator with XRE-family HTH domain
VDLDIGKRLRQLRISRGLSPEGLAKQTGFYPFYITGVETGTAVLSLPNLEKWARALGIRLWELFLEDGEQRISVSSQEEELVRKFRKASPSDRSLLLRLATFFSEAE